MSPSTGMGGAWGGFGLLPALGSLVLLLAVVALVAYLVVRLASESGDDRTADAALGTLRERFARGEIDAQEYEERRGRLVG